MGELNIWFEFFPNEEKPYEVWYQSGEFAIKFLAAYKTQAKAEAFIEKEKSKRASTSNRRRDGRKPANRRRS